MSDNKPNVISFEQDDFYGPDLKLEVDCSNLACVAFRLSGSANGVRAELEYTLFMSDQVDRIIAELTLWRERERARTGR